MGRILEAHPVERPERRDDRLKPIYMALAALLVTGVIITGTLIGALWLLAQAAAWLAHIPQVP